MITPFEDARMMLLMVAKALGPEMLTEVAFVGGCTTSMLITDDFGLEFARYTDDVDVIVDIIGRKNWYELQKMLENKGFRQTGEDNLLCRFRLGELKVDFMPHDSSILGFTNRWYEAALATAQTYALSDELSIRILTPPLFIATKLEAYLGRGNDDPMGSKDIEDILALIDGRPELVNEILSAGADIRDYISDQFGKLIKNPYFEYAVQGSARSSRDREELMFQRIESLINVT